MEKSDGKSENFFTRLVSLTLRFPKTVLFLSLALTAVSIYYTSKIAIRSNFSDLLPDNHPAVVEARRLEKVVGGASFIVVTVETKNPGAAVAFLTDFKQKIVQEQLSGIRYIDDQPPVEFFKKEGLLYLTPGDLDQLTEDINGRITAAKLKKTHLYLDLLEDEKQTGFDAALSEYRQKFGGLLQNGSHYQNEPGTLFVSLIKPEWRPTDVSKTTAMVDRLDKIVRELDPKKYDPSLSVRFTGPYIKTVTQKKILVRDASVVSIVSFIGSILYIYLHFRRKRAVLLIGVPLTLSSLWALSLAYFFFGSLNLFSSVACAVLLGLATDYGIHIYTDYARYRVRTDDVAESLRRTVSDLGIGFVAASFTTAAAFFALMLSRFKALYEFGAIAGCGILLCFIAYVVIFPPLTALFEKYWPLHKGHIAEELQRQPMHEKIPIRWIFSRKNLVISGLVLLLPFLAVIAGKLRFDYNLNHIMGQQATRELDRDVDGIFNHSVNPEVALVDRPEDAAPLAAAIRKVQEKNEKSPQGTTIKGVVALSDFLPPDQPARIEKIKGIKTLFTDFVVRSMKGKDRDSYNRFKTMLDPTPVTQQDLPEQITRSFEDREGKIGRTVFIFPNFEMTQADKFMRFVEEIREVHCDGCSGPFYASGESTVYYEIVQMLFREGKYIIGFAALCVFGALLISFRSFKSTFLIFSPLVVGMFATFGWMALTGIRFNIINLAALPIILGSVDDYAVLFYQRYREHPSESLEASYRLSLAPILGSAMTSILGFGSLAFADMGGVRSFGLLCVVGTVFCTAATVIWFPALLAFFDRREKQKIAAAE
jgi:hypothetical protein